MYAKDYYRCLIMAEDYDSFYVGDYDGFWVDRENSVVFPGSGKAGTDDITYERTGVLFEDSLEEDYKIVTFGGDLWRIDPDKAYAIHLGESDVEDTDDDAEVIDNTDTRIAATTYQFAGQRLNYDFYDECRACPSRERLPCRIAGHIVADEKDFWVFANKEDTPEFLEECSQCILWLLTGEDSPRFQKGKHNICSLFLLKLDTILTKKANEDPQTMNSFMGTLLDRLAQNAAVKERRFMLSTQKEINKTNVSLSDFLAATVEIKKTLEELKKYKTDLQALREEYLRETKHCSDLLHTSNEIIKWNAELNRVILKHFPQ